jgi:hypothetical protein
MTPEEEQRGRERLVLAIVIIVEVVILAGVFLGLKYLGVIP